MGENSMEAEGSNGRMILDGTSITISRKGTGLITFLNQGLQGDKMIPIHQITAVQLKEPGFATRGYLRLSINGRDPVGGALGAVKDENAVLFDMRNLKEFEAMRDAIKARINIGPSNGSISMADEIEKLAALRDKGLLTDEEFTAKKRQILGI